MLKYTLFLGKKDVESKIFHSLFPKVPIVGFFGNGEIGFNSKNTYKQDEEFEVRVVFFFGDW